MEEQLQEKFNKLENEQLPESFHMRMIGYIVDRKLKTPFYVILSLFGINLALSVWNLLARLAENDSLSVIKESLEAFSPTSDFLSELWTALRESFPGHALALFLLNFLIVCYGIYIIFKLRSYNRKRSAA